MHIQRKFRHNQEKRTDFMNTIREHNPMDGWMDSQEDSQLPWKTENG